MTDPVEILSAELAGLLREVSPRGIQLFLAGGFGVLLRVRRASDRGVETFGPLPAARATRDLDLILTADLIVDSSKTEQLRRALDDLGYEPVESARYHQFEKEVTVASDGFTVKIDLLAEEPHDSAPAMRDERRIRPLEFSGLHGHRTLEAVAITENPVEIPLGRGIQVLTPNLLSFWLLKLFALKDRVESDDRDHARRHAFDIYALWAATNLEEWTNAMDVAGRHTEHQRIREARGFVESLLGTDTSMGSLRLIEGLRQEGIEPDLIDINGFRSALSELLPPA